MMIGTGVGAYMPGLSPYASSGATGGAVASGASAAATMAAPLSMARAAAETGGGTQQGMTPEEQAAIAKDRATANVMNDKFAKECQTCKNRTYQDGSNDPGVSFKTPQHIDPSASASVVMGHEQEHVTRNKAAAEAEGGEVLSSTVVLHGDICPECGRYYIAGGTTYTTTRSGGEDGKGENGGQASEGKGLDITA